MHAPDGGKIGGAEAALAEAQAEAERAARSVAVRIANRMLAALRDRGALTAQEHDLKAQALSFVGDSAVWNAYLNDSLLGSGPTPEQAIQAAVQEYERAIGYGTEPGQFVSREALEQNLAVCLEENDS